VTTECVCVCEYRRASYIMLVTGDDRICVCEYSRARYLMLVTVHFRMCV
jgi:hypothetical protein